jgi:hypothetical protein
MQQNPVTVNFIDTSLTVSQPVPVTAANPLPVTIAAGGADADVNIAAVGGTATVTAGVNGLLAVGGNVAHDAVDSGNPAKIGGYASSAQPTAVAAGDRVNAWYGLSGMAVVAVVGSTSGVGADGSNQGGMWSAAGSALNPLGAAAYTFNGTNWDRRRGPAGAVGSAYVENGPYTAGVATADTQIKATAGFIHTVTISPSGTVTAGVLTIYNSAVESGTVVAVFALPITTFTPFSVILDVACGTGIYVGFDATLANVSCTVSFR